MGSVVSKQIQRRIDIHKEERALLDLSEIYGSDFPGSNHRPFNRKIWMEELDPKRLRIGEIVWPGSHDSATDEIGIPGISRPFAQCQSISIYNQLVRGTRVLDIRVEEHRRVCHGILVSYIIDDVIDDVIKFLSETKYEVVVLDIRTEFGHQDPPGFENYLVDRLGEYLIHHDEGIFGKTVDDLFPKRVICVWKPRNSAKPKVRGPVWSEGYLRDNWIDTDLPETKFENNMKRLGENPRVSDRKYFYRVESTLTPQTDNLVLCVKPVTSRIHGYARLFISQCHYRGLLDRLQIFSTDFIDEDFVDACVGVTYARIEGKA